MTPCQRVPEAPSGLPRLRLQDTAITAQGGRERQGGSGTVWIGRGMWGGQGTTIRPAAIKTLKYCSIRGGRCAFVGAAARGREQAESLRERRRVTPVLYSSARGASISPRRTQDDQRI